MIPVDYGGVVSVPSVLHHEDSYLLTILDFRSTVDIPVCKPICSVDQILIIWVNISLLFTELRKGDTVGDCFYNAL